MIHVAGKAKSREVWLNGHYLEIGPSQRLKFLDIGYDWGDYGHGNSQLALAVLFELTGDKAFSEANYKDFEAEWVAKLPVDKDFLGWSKLDEWITARGGKIKNGYKVPYTA